jgi:dinuclear metal center YbgI/SA1388 family protein
LTAPSKSTQRRATIKETHAPLARIVSHLDRYLDIRGIADWDGAWNGLQIENSGTVTKIGAAVDGCEYTLREAARRGVNLLLVHHGLFWKGGRPWTGAAYRKMKLALGNDLALYSAHLPLDVHPAVGNNALLCASLGFKKKTPFLFGKGRFIGWQARCALTREDLARRLEKSLGSEVKIIPGGPARVTRVGVVTGGAGGEIYAAAGEGIDTFITGEGPHWTYAAAEELGINVLYGGHYATETFGVKALAAHLSERFGVPWEFIDHPTGL